MKYLLDKERFSVEIENRFGENDGHTTIVGMLLIKYLKDIVDEPHHPSGLDREDINVRNALRKELREE